MKTTPFIILLLCFVTSISAQDWTGFYEFTVDKDGYVANVQAQVYQMSGDYWGQLRVSGNEAFGESWEVEFWTIMNEGESLDCYYHKGNDAKFPKNDALLFSLIGNKAKLETTFGQAFIDAVKHSETHLGFTFNPNAGKIETFTSTEIVETPANPTATTETPAIETQPTLTPPKSSMDLLIGRWQGEDASDMTKFFDYDFYLDGTGRRGSLDFNWTLQSEGGQEYIDIQFFKPISRAKYQSYFEKVDTDKTGAIEDKDNLRILKTTDGETLQFKINGNNYALLDETKRFTIDSIESKSLTLSFEYNGKTVKTLHYKE